MNPVTVGFINGTTPIIADATSLAGAVFLCLECEAAALVAAGAGALQ